MEAKKWTRRLWHLLGGSFFPILALFVSKETLLISLSAVTVAFLIFEGVRLFTPRLSIYLSQHLPVELKRGERTGLTGSSYFLMASLLAFIFFERDVAFLAILFLAVGDPLAASVGEVFKLPTKSPLWRKSPYGSIACFLSCLAVGMLLREFALHISPLLVLGGAVAATLFELLPCPIDDNLLIPLGSGGVMTLIIYLV